MDIKTRLNRCCGKPIGGYNCREGMRCPDCFDKLEGLREIEELNERVETLRQVVRDQTAHGVEQMKEIERLREALVGLMKVQNGPPLTAWTNDWLEAMKKADAALEQTESGG